MLLPVALVPVVLANPTSQPVPPAKPPPWLDLGAELFASSRFGESLMLVAGFDFSIPRHLDARFVSPNYGTRDVLGSVRWLLDRKANSFVYLEGRTGATRDAAGERAEDVVMLGIRFNYSLRRGIGKDPMPEWRSSP